MSQPSWIVYKVTFTLYRMGSLAKLFYKVDISFSVHNFFMVQYRLNATSHSFDSSITSDKKIA